VNKLIAYSPRPSDTSSIFCWQNCNYVDLQWQPSTSTWWKENERRSCRRGRKLPASRVDRRRLLLLLLVLDAEGRLKTRDWKTRDHNTGGGKRETISYGTPKW